MHPILKKTFGGLTRKYYFRHFFFAAVFLAFFSFSMLGPMLSSSKGSASGTFFVFFTMVLNTFLYPYSRFVYETIMDFIVGDNLFFGNAIFVLLTKLFTMVLCFSLATVIAPIGLLYLYFHHTNKEKSNEV
jgi:hypothetical protein